MLARALTVATLAAFLAACGATPAREGDPRRYQLAGGVTTTFLPGLDNVNRECEQRMRNGKVHWGCATYNRETDHCEIVVQPVRNKLDWDRAALLGIELNNCNRLRAGEPDE